MAGGTARALVRLWWADVTDDRAASSRLLSAAERAHVDRIRARAARDAQALSYVMRRAILAELGAIAPETVRVARRCPTCGGTDHGRPSVVVPELASTRGISVSHGPAHVALALAPVEIGVDVEGERPAATWTEVARLTDHPDDDVASPLHRWTAKEAVLKLLGTGLARPMTDVAIAGSSWRTAEARGTVRWRALPGSALSAVAAFEDFQLEVDRWFFEAGGQWAAGGGPPPTPGGSR